MTPKQFYQSHSVDECKKIAEMAGTNIANFKHIALYNGAVSKDLANRLDVASGGVMSRDEILFPEDYEDSAA